MAFSTKQRRTAVACACPDLLEQVTANLSPGRTRYATLNGRKYLVAPITLIVPGVLAGSKGPLYYPPEEVSRDPSIWNGVPLVLNHPRINGRFVSANTDGVFSRWGLGVVRNAHICPQGKLRAEGWFDVEKTRQVDVRVLDALMGNRPIEVSTGLFTENEAAPAGANYQGRPYAWIARNYKADHLAILPDQVGACSLSDGCGVLANYNPGQPRDDYGKWTSVGGGSMLAPHTGSEGAGSGKGKPTKVSVKMTKRLTREEKGAIDAYSGSHGQTINDRLRTGKAKPATKEEISLWEARAKYKAFGRGQRTARDHAIDDRRGFDYDTALLDSALSKGQLQKATTLYRGVTFPKGKDPLAKSAGKTLTEKGFLSTTNNVDSALGFTEYGSGTKYLMEIKVPKGTPALDMNKSGVFQQRLVGHESEVLLPRGLSIRVEAVSKHPTLKGVSVVRASVVKSKPIQNASIPMNEQDKVNLLKRFARFLGVNNLQTQTCDGSQPKKRKKGKLPEQTTNHATQGDVSMALSQKQREQIVDELIANSEYWAEEDRGMLASMSDRKLQALNEKLEKELNAEAVANAARQGASELTDNAATPPQLEKKGKGKAKPEDEEEDMEEGEKKKLTTNAQPLTADEWKKQAPPEVQAVFNHAEAIMAREKAALVAKLTANASDEQKKAIEPIYNAMDFEKLQVLAAAVPEKKEEPPVSYFGAATPIGNMAMDDNARKDILPLPTIDWAKEAKATK